MNKRHKTLNTSRKRHCWNM